MDWLLTSEQMGGMTTGQLNALLPGLSSTYGPNQPVDIEIDIHWLGNFQSFEDKQEVLVAGDLDLKFFVHDTKGKVQNACGIALENVSVGISSQLDDMTISLQLTRAINAQTVVVLYSSIGNLSPT